MVGCSPAPDHLSTLSKVAECLTVTTKGALKFKSTDLHGSTAILVLPTNNLNFCEFIFIYGRTIDLLSSTTIASLPSCDRDFIRKPKPIDSHASTTTPAFSNYYFEEF